MASSLIKTWEQDNKLVGILFSAPESGLRTEWWGGETGIFFKICCICRRYSTEGISGLLRNSPGKANGAPKRTSAAETAESSLGTLRSPRRTRGR